MNAERSQWQVLISRHLIVAYVWTQSFFHLPRFNQRGVSPTKIFLGYPGHLKTILLHWNPNRLLKYVTLIVSALNN